MRLEDIVSNERGCPKAPYRRPPDLQSNGLPIALELTAGQADDGRSAADMLDTLGDCDVLLAPCAYDYVALGIEMAARSALPPEAYAETPAGLSASLDRYRNFVERFFDKLRHFRIRLRHTGSVA